jgi:CBS domain-containing protein
LGGLLRAVDIQGRLAYMVLFTRGEHQVANSTDAAEPAYQATTKPADEAAAKPADQVAGFNKEQVARWRAELAALGGALLFVALGFAAILLVAKVADVKDGTVLASLLILPALLYLLLSDRVTDLKGPGGLEVQLANVAKQSIPMAGHEQDGAALAYEQIRAVERGRVESFYARVRNITDTDPVVLTLTSGSGPIDADAAADYARGLTQFPRFRFIAVLKHDGTLISYMDESSFRHVIAAKVVDAAILLSDIEHENASGVRQFPGMLTATVTPGDSIADALRSMDRVRADALLVAEDGRIKGIVERDRLANALLLTILDRVSGK